jgi:AraC-like DNA-binding protein
VSDVEPGGRVLVHGRPPLHLSRFVLSYEGYRECGTTPFVLREVPRGFAVLIIGFGPPFRVSLGGLAPDRGAEHRSFFAGAYDLPAMVGSTGNSHCLQVNLSLPGAVRVLGMPLREFTNRAVALDDVIGSASALTERLWDAATWQARFALVSDWLDRRIAAAAPPPPDLEWAWWRLEQMSEADSVRQIAAEMGCSRKHLSLRFHDRFGLPPSTIRQVLRFARILARLERDPAQALARLALDGGYNDQPHLNRAFQRFAGLTPTAYLRQRLPSPGGIAEPG